MSAELVAPILRCKECDRIRLSADADRWRAYLTSYLSMGSGFSRAGLIKQLTSSYGEAFSRADAIFAVDHLNVNWNEQAVESAKSYLSTGSGFSRAGLIQQLTSSCGEAFTYAQAVYAANTVGL